MTVLDVLDKISSLNKNQRLGTPKNFIFSPERSLVTFNLRLLFFWIFFLEKRMHFVSSFENLNLFVSNQFSVLVYLLPSVVPICCIEKISLPFVKATKSSKAFALTGEFKLYIILLIPIKNIVTNTEPCEFRFAMFWFWKSVV